MSSSRGVNGDHTGGPRANRTTPKDASTTGSSPRPARRVPAPLLATTAAIAALLWIEIPIYILTKGHS